MVIERALRVSQRGHLAPPSPVRKLTPLAVAARARGIHIYHLNIGQPDLATPAPILERIRNYDAPLVPYAPSLGLPETIAAWSAYYTAVGLAVEPDELVVTAGGSEALSFAFMAVADPGDRILAFEPTYANYFGFAVVAGVDVDVVSLSGDDGYHLPSEAMIEAHITPRTRAIVIANPNNPTGTVYSRDELRMLLEIGLRHGLFIIADETYRELVFDDLCYTDMLALDGGEDCVIVADSASKRFSATGLRVGCLVSRNAQVMDAVGRFAQARLAGPTVEQRAVVPMLLNSRPYTDELRALYQRRRDVVVDALEQVPNARYRRPTGAFYIMVGLPVDDCDTFARWLLTDFDLEGETVMIAPGAGFYLNPGLGRSEARLAYVLDEPDLARSVEILAEALRLYPGAIADKGA